MRPGLRSPEMPRDPAVLLLVLEASMRPGLRSPGNGFGGAGKGYPRQGASMRPGLRSPGNTSSMGWSNRSFSELQ